jgi:hypothetical protein
MLTVEVRLNGQIVAAASIENVSALAEISDYRVSWAETEGPELGIAMDGGAFEIAGHRRRSTAWALVAKVVTGILGQMIAPKEGRG